MTSRRKATMIKRLNNQWYRNILNKDPNVQINIKKRIDTLKNTPNV